MRGLEEYVNRHGKHFTEKLAYKVAGNKWSSDQVKKAAQRKVYYNVTGSTLGDMVYLTNEVGDKEFYKSIHSIINYVLHIVEDYRYHDGRIFDEWVQEMMNIKVDIDLRPYV